MSDRRRLTPTDRRSVYNLTGGRCAYCGQELAFRDIQVDHVVPLHLGGADEAFNMFPACRSCNHYKRGMELERWRAQLEAIPATLARDCYTYRQGVRFGLVKPVSQKVEFYSKKYEIIGNIYDNPELIGGGPAWTDGLA